MLAETANDSQPWLQTTGGVLLALILIVACLCAWLTNLIAMPGNWICVLLIALYAWLGPADGRPAIGYGVVIAGFGCAFAGEVFEFLAGAWGAKRAGAGRKSTLYSILGSIAGALTGALVGIPIPVIGPVIAAIVFGGVGAAAGAMERKLGGRTRDVLGADLWNAGKTIRGNCDRHRRDRIDRDLTIRGLRDQIFSNGIWRVWR
jgi:uncharacterized protein YqgC (DUF456 family)